jgi:hypothetical protein
MDKQPKMRLKITKRYLLDISILILVALILIVLPIIDAHVTPPKWQKHKWMLTETFGTGATPLEMLNMSQDEMDRRLQNIGLKRAFDEETDPEYCRIWKGNGVEFIYTKGNNHYLLLLSSGTKISPAWKLDSGVKLGQSDNEVQAVYGIPDSVFLQYFTYTYVLNSNQYIRASFSFDEQGLLKSVGYVFRQRYYLDKLFFRVKGLQ